MNFGKKRWSDRIQEKLDQIEAEAERQGALFQRLVNYLTDARAVHQSTTVERGDGVAVVRHKGRDVFAVEVLGDVITVHRNRDDAETFRDPEAALDRMAELVARAVLAGVGRTSPTQTSY